jgi:hypothetical protein
VPLISTPTVIFSIKTTTVTPWKRGMAKEPECLRWTRERSIAQLGKTNKFRPDRRYSTYKLSFV